MYVHVRFLLPFAQMMHRSSGDKARGSLKILQGGETKANGGQDNEASGRKNELSIVPICFECCYHAYHIIVTITICPTWNVYVRTIYIYIRIHIRFPSSTPHTPEVDSTKRMKHETPTIGRILKRCFGSQIDRGSGIGCFGIMCVCVCHLTCPHSWFHRFFVVTRLIWLWNHWLMVEILSAMSPQNLHF